MSPILISLPFENVSALLNYLVRRIISVKMTSCFPVLELIKHVNLFLMFTCAKLANLN